MTPRSFARRYAEVMGITPAKAVERARAEAARALLREFTEGWVSVARVAHAVGFGCEKSLVRAFRRWHGLTPAAMLEQWTREQGMTETERDELLQTIDKRLVCLSANLDRQVGNILYYLFEQLDRIERLVGGDPPLHQPPGEYTPQNYPPVAPAKEAEHGAVEGAFRAEGES